MEPADPPTIDSSRRLDTHGGVPQH